MIGQRRLARILAFQTLFELESRPTSQLDEALRGRVSSLNEDAGEPLTSSSVAFASNLVAGTLHEQEAIDRLLEEAAPAFPIEQMATTDRVALELAVHEMMSEPSTPLRVAINEAVELAKTYGGDSSGRLVNGVLGTIAENMAEGRVTSGIPRPRNE